MYFQSYNLIVFVFRAVVVLSKDNLPSTLSLISTNYQDSRYVYYNLFYAHLTRIYLKIEYILVNIFMYFINYK